MFAIALFDRSARQLYLARDRFGEKPLYYGYAGGAFVFASELKALRVMPDFDGTLDRIALQRYMQVSYVPAPQTIYTSMRKLPPGTWLRLTMEDLSSRVLPAPRIYWSAADVARHGARDPLEVDEAEAIQGLDQVLGRAVQSQMISDVPLGAFLSGGVDSSTIVALMQAGSSRPIRTYSIGFEESEFDESRHAAAIARHLGTDHTELTARSADMLSLVDRMPEIYDEPFADPSQLPTCMVAALARQHVTVALSGDGGDELFGGYNRYNLAAGNWPRIERFPQALRSGIASGLRCVPAATWDRLGAAYHAVTPSRHRVRMISEKVHKIADVIASENGEALYRGLVGPSWRQTPVLLESTQQAAPYPPLEPLSGLANQMMLADTLAYLPDDILVKVDRASMAVGLESRVPMLDSRVFEYAWRLPLRMKVGNGKGKWILRQLLYRYVPRSLIERPKMGFAVPLKSWLRGPLREWAEDLLAEGRLRSEGYLASAPVRRKWHEHLTGRRDWQYELWNVLMFQAWLTQQSRPAG
jgi:asparagine synthase (glutamine-hydrolysing)